MQHILGTTAYSIGLSPNVPCASLAATTALTLGGVSVLTLSSLNNYSTTTANDNKYAIIINPSFTSGSNTLALSSTQLQINSQISALIGSGANTVQFAMGTTGVGLQYGQATGLFANSTYIEVNGPLAFDNVTTF